MMPDTRKSSSLPVPGRPSRDPRIEIALTAALAKFDDAGYATGDNSNVRFITEVIISAVFSAIGHGKMK